MPIIANRITAPCERVAGPGPGVGPRPGGGGAKGSATVTITAPVGRRGRNLEPDVRALQDALNRVPPHQGGPGSPLAVDGRCGPKTESAIQTFQLHHFGWKGADGLVEPGRQTIARLNEVLGTEPGGAIGAAVLGDGAVAAKALVNPLNAAQLTAAVALARRYINAARANLLMARPHLAAPSGGTGGPPFGGLGRPERMRLANKHLAIDAFGAQRAAAFEKVVGVYDRMDSLFQRPGGLWGAAVFEPDPLEDVFDHRGWGAYSYFGGYFLQGQKEWTPVGQVRMDSVYLCRKLATVSPEVQACTVVHELAHFVARNQEIADYGYIQHKSTMQALVPSQRICNAASYEAFAYEADTGVEPTR